MSLSSLVKTAVTGLSVPQEFCCVDANNFKFPLQVILSWSAGFERDVTGSHLFLGYKPVLIGLVFGSDDADYPSLAGQQNVLLKFINADDGARVVARLTLAAGTMKTLGDGSHILIYKATNGTHHFLNKFHRQISKLRQFFRQSDQGNVSLPGNLQDQVRIAYAVPRIVSIITVTDGTNMNMFPTDLHGQIGEKYYVSSLRTGGLANEQVSQFKTLVISQVCAAWHTISYGLGKNHMRHLRPESDFNLHQQRSAEFYFPLPAGAVRYRELVQIEAVQMGIHTLHFYEVRSQHEMQDHGGVLAHIHQFYLQWRINHGLKTAWFRRAV